MGNSWWLISLLSAVSASTLLAFGAGAQPVIDLDIIPPLDLFDPDDLEPRDPMAQVTSASQLSDVQPTDWAFTALQSLIERYGCIAGYPNGTYQGNRALSRYEFAAGLNACLDRINELIAAASANLLTQQDLISLQRLQAEFAAELAILRGRVDNLEMRAAELEANQFTATGKLFGTLRVQANATLSGEGEAEANLQYNLFLGILTSFTGKDLLLTSIGTSNTTFRSLAPDNNGRFVGFTGEGFSDTSGSGDAGNTPLLLNLAYRFPIGDRLVIQIIAAERYIFDPILLPQFLPYYNVGSGPVSTFATAPPIYLVGAGQGAAINYEFLDNTILTLTYLATFGGNPGQGTGLFNGDYIASAQININPTPKFFFQLLYHHGYFAPGNFGYFNGQTFRDRGFVGTALANRFDDAGIFFDDASAVSSNTYQIGSYYAFSPKLTIGGWVSLTKARLLGRGDADIWTYSLQALLLDLFGEGDQFGLVVGMEPTLTGLRIGDRFVGGFKNDTSLHLEIYYQYQLNDHISISPSVIWITAPNQDAENEDIVVGGVRTTFKF